MPFTYQMLQARLKIADKSTDMQTDRHIIRDKNSHFHVLPSDLRCTKIFFFMTLPTLRLYPGTVFLLLPISGNVVPSIFDTNDDFLMPYHAPVRSLNVTDNFFDASTVKTIA